MSTTEQSAAATTRRMAEAALARSFVKARKLKPRFRPNPSGGFFVASSRKGRPPCRVTSDFRCECEGYRKAGHCFHSAAVMLAWDGAQSWIAHYTAIVEVGMAESRNQRTEGVT